MILDEDAKERVSIEIQIKSLPSEYDETKPFHYSIFSKKADYFTFKVLNKDAYEVLDKYMDLVETTTKFGDLKDYQCRSNCNIDSIFALYLPLYTYIRLIMNISLSHKIGCEFKYDSETNETYMVNALPIIGVFAKDIEQS